MLHLKSLEVTNFGPFKGKQRLDFSDAPGVSILYGENMRGKTSVLNAIRFALFGTVLGRGRRAVSFRDLVNLEARAEGERHFEVSLELTHAGASYRLTRTGRPAPGGSDEYVASSYLERGGHILSPEQAALELERILPKEIARFFLFDGELLQEYEDLLHGDSAMGPQISAAIERILGLPILTGSRDSAKAALDRAEVALAVAAQGDQKTREFGNQLQSLAAEREVLSRDLLRLEHNLEDLRSRKAAIEDDMRRRERLMALLDKRDRLKNDLTKANAHLDASALDLGAAMAPAWAALIRPRLEAAVADLRVREAGLQAAVTRAQVLHSLAHGQDPVCPTCLQVVGKDAQDKIRALVEGAQDAGDDVSQRELALIRRRLDALDAQLSVANPEALRILWSRHEGLANNIYAIKGEIEEIGRQLSGGSEEEELRGLGREYDSVVRQMVATEDGISKTQSSLAQNVTYRENIQRRLAKLANGQMDAERRRRDLVGQVHELFKTAVDAYREELRKRVEAEASAFFRKMTTEPDYAGLRINDSYGLTIIHRDGTTIPVRSAGAEHVVALSLVAALQNNAPLRGPIFIDSPFGRLDAGHRSRILATLPHMADQVVLLVYEDELPAAFARQELKGQLRAEWILNRETARHTRIVSR
jgi:DNA sulfur modification protein DndD